MATEQPRVAIATGPWRQPVGCLQNFASWCELVGHNLEQACNCLGANNPSCAISRGLNTAPEALQQHPNYLGLLPIALPKLEEPRPGLLQVLGQEWSIGPSRLGAGGRWLSASKP